MQFLAVRCSILLLLFSLVVLVTLVNGAEEQPRAVVAHAPAGVADVDPSKQEVKLHQSPPVELNQINSSSNNNNNNNNNNNGASLEPRISDKNFITDILNRLHSLDTDIGKLLFNSSSMYAADDQSAAFRDNQPKGGERFTEVLSDLDALQDEIGGLINNATRSRQYNILVRLRPLNTMLYRIRHNLHLMRNSLVTINAIASLERVSNDVMDTTLQAFLKPDANVSEEIGDDGNYDIDLNRPLATNATLAKSSSSTTTTTTSSTTLAPSTTTTTTPSTTTTSATTTTTVKPLANVTNATTERPPRRSTRQPNRRTNNRNNQRRTSTSTQKPSSPAQPRE